MFETTNATFINDVLKPSYRAAVVVMFHASWCAPCAAMKPTVARHSLDTPFVLVGVDGGVEPALASSEGVRNVPALLLYRDGQQVGTSLVGGQSPAQISAWLKSNCVETQP